MNKRVYLFPFEVETEMQKQRENDGFTGKVEEAAIKTMVETAKQNGKFGDKILIVLSPEYIHIPDWQRKMKISRALSIGNNYNRYKWEVPKILYYKGKLWCVDGMHRIYGAFRGKMKMITVEIMDDITEKEAIDLFLNQTDDRSHMSPMDTYHAAIAAGKPEYLKLKSICTKNNVQIKGDTGTVKNPSGILTSISDGVNMAKSNPELLNKILRLINRLQWNGYESVTEGKAYSAKVLRVLKKLYSYYPENEKDLEKILLANCKGAKYFRDNLAEPWQDSLFDHLAGIVAQYMDSSIVVPMPVKQSKRKVLEG